MLLLGLLVPLAACQPISQLDQAELSKPGRKFEERGAYGTSCGIVSQVEGGRLNAGGASSNSGGC